MLTYATPKGNPHLIPTGAAPTFAADGSDISDWLQAGRSFRRAATQAAMIAFTGMADRDIAVVDAIPGAWFVFDGAAGLWRMFGVPRFADATARNAAISVPAKGMRCVLTGGEFTTYYNGTTWRIWESDWITYTPTKTAFVVGTGGAALDLWRYRYEGEQVRVKLNMILGTTGFSVGSNPTFTLPVPSLALTHQFEVRSGVGIALNAVAGVLNSLVSLADDTNATAFRLYYIGPAPTAITATAPFTWTAGCRIDHEFTYQPA